MDRGIVVDTRKSPHSLLRAVPIASARIEDGFWAPRRRAMREAGLGHQFKMCEATGRIDNFRRLSNDKDVPFRGRVFNDSDVYKLLEAASHALAERSDDDLAAATNGVIEAIVGAQRADGYVNSYFAREREHQRYSDLTTQHELYCAGHLIQAGIAHRRATGGVRLFDVARRFADHICDSFGPHAREGVDGHEEIELALAELCRETGEDKYLDQALYFLEARGRKPSVMPATPGAFERAYYQDHLPVTDQTEAMGHAVRAAYLASGMMDAALETDRPDMARAKYADAMETAVYNGALAGVSLDGTKYFYMNPLASSGGYERADWFDCACCPPNIARLLMSLPAYCYSTSEDSLWVHLYAAGGVRAELPDGRSLEIEVDTSYPWDGDVRLTVVKAPDSAVAIRMRIPGWCNVATVNVNRRSAQAMTRPGTYSEIKRRWDRGDVVSLSLPMPVRRLSSHPRVTGNHGRMAIARGPLIYCLEAVDHPGIDLFEVALRRLDGFDVMRDHELLGGVTVLRTAGERLVEPAGEGALHRAARRDAGADKIPITAIPYYAWGNRGAGAMQVWIPAV